MHSTPQNVYKTLALKVYIMYLLPMNLKQFIESKPRNERKAIRQKIAKVCGVSEITVRSWANGNRGMPPQYLLLLVKKFPEMTIDELLKSYAA